MSSETEFNSLRTFEADYDRAQGQIRQAASVWVLAGFAAVAYSLSKDLPDGLPRPIFGALVCWGSAFGLFILWIIDQRVYQRLLHSVFVQGLFLEWKSQSTSNPLPLIRTKIYFDTQNISFKLSLFYIVPVAAFFCVQTYFTFFNAGIPVLLTGAGFVAYSLLFSHGVVAVWMYLVSLENKNLVDQHGAAYPEAFQNYLRNKSYASELKVWLAR